MIETNRLILRPWFESDAEELFNYARNPKIGPIAGWPVHTSVENSREIIKNVLSAKETYALILKETGLPVGSIGIIFEEAAHAPLAKNEVEIGYWIGEPYWGQGLVPEAVNAVINYCYNVLKCTGIWCSYYDGNEKSKRVQEKCGFVYHHTKENVPCPLMNDIRTEHFTYQSRK